MKYLNDLGDITFNEYFDKFDLVVDAIFGFSVQFPIRPPYDNILESFKIIKCPIFSVDIPSGWDIDKGNKYSNFRIIRELILSLIFDFPHSSEIRFYKLLR